MICSINESAGLNFLKRMSINKMCVQVNNHSSILFQYVSGNIRNTEKVYYKERHNFILKIIARDCGGRQSKAVFINILVKEKCKPQWTSKGILQIKLTSRRLSVWNLCCSVSVYPTQTGLARCFCIDIDMWSNVERWRFLYWLFQNHLGRLLINNLF